MKQMCSSARASLVLKPLHIECILRSQSRLQTVLFVTTQQNTTCALTHAIEHGRTRVLTKIHKHLHSHMDTRPPPPPPALRTDVCFVFERLGENLLALIKENNYEGIPMLIVKEVRQARYGHDACHRGILLVYVPSRC